MVFWCGFLSNRKFLLVLENILHTIFMTCWEKILLSLINRMFEQYLKNEMSTDFWTPLCVILISMKNLIEKGNRRGGRFIMLFRRFLFWIRRDRRARNCGKLCVICPYYELCRIDELEGRKTYREGGA